MRRIEAKLRMIERQLMCINTPSKLFNRTLLQNAKIKELKNISEQIYQAQCLINELDFADAAPYQTSLDNLEAIRRELLFPSVTVICEC